MPDLSFEFDWVDAEGINGRELSATWASFRIRAGDSIVTRVLDGRAKTVRDFVYVPLYPLAEWLASNWWFLTHELESPAKECDPDFHRRHALRAAREGYAYPDLEIVTTGARTRLVWKRDLLQWSRVEFLEQGETWVDSDALRDTCADFIDQVIRRLAALDVGETLLRDEWNAIQSADDEESQFCRAAAGLGWDPYDLDEGKSGWILSLARRLGNLLDEAVPAIVIGEPSDWHSIVRNFEEARRCNSLALERLRSFRDDVRPHGTPDIDPWRAGYDFARRLRRSLDLEGEPLPTMTQLSAALGEDAETVEKVTKQRVDLGDWPTLVDGFVTRNDIGLPAFAFRRRSDDSRRFLFCRALAEVLLSPGPDTLLTRAHSERQQCNRAFAAEFLAPSAELRRRVARPVVDGDDIDELATVFGVSSLVIEHQIRNHRIASVW